MGLITKRAVFVLDAVCLFEQESASGHTMLERNSLDRHGAVFVDYLVLTRVDGVEDDLVLPIVGVVIE